MWSALLNCRAVKGSGNWSYVGCVENGYTFVVHFHPNGQVDCRPDMETNTIVQICCVVEVRCPTARPHRERCFGVAHEAVVLRGREDDGPSGLPLVGVLLIVPTTARATHICTPMARVAR